MAVDNKFITLGDPSKNARVVENKAGSSRARSLLKEQSCGEAGKAATHYHAIVGLRGLSSKRRNLVVCSVTDCVRVVNDLLRIAGGALVIALARIAGPPLALGHDLPGSGSGKKGGARCEKRSIQEIAARYPFFQAQDFI